MEEQDPLIQFLGRSDISKSDLIYLLDFGYDVQGLIDNIDDGHISCFELMQHLLEQARKDNNAMTELLKTNDLVKIMTSNINQAPPSIEDLISKIERSKN
ncbi:MAG: hypothetical protein BGO31_14240 [Bacteroidetes bacterium 43-16]|nr:MAG: hypothetical protein BGO31_14240 [Bacteroidetes bacterium 43-16]